MGYLSSTLLSNIYFFILRLMRKRASNKALNKPPEAKGTSGPVLAGLVVVPVPVAVVAVGGGIGVAVGVGVGLAPSVVEGVGTGVDGSGDGGWGETTLIL